jgi:hypothetical protein
MLGTFLPGGDILFFAIGLFFGLPRKLVGKEEYRPPTINAKQLYRWLLALPIPLGLSSLGFVDATNVLFANDKLTSASSSPRETRRASRRLVKRLVGYYRI